MAAARVWEGAEGLRRYLKPINHFERTPANRNPRRGEVEEIAASLKRFGQVRLVLTDGRYIIAGNHTHAAAVSLGWTHIAVVVNEFASPAEARAYLLADNRIPELGSYDDPQRLALLEELDRTGAWEGTGYQVDDLEDLRHLHNQVPETDTEPFAGGYAVTPEELAARAAQLAGGRTVQEVSLLLTREQSDQFDSDLRILRKEYDLAGGGITELVSRAAAEQALLLNQA